MYNGEPLYKANDFITPRYLRGISLENLLQKNTEGYNIKKAMNFQVSFIVTEKGKVENIKIIKGITYGFDNEVIKIYKIHLNTGTPRGSKLSLFKLKCCMKLNSSIQLSGN